MTTPRQNADPAVRYFMDNTTKCWARKENSDEEWFRVRDPAFSRDDLEYYVGHEPPPIKRTVTLTVNGRGWVLPEPLRETPRHNQLVFYISDDGTVRTYRWNSWVVLPTLYKEQRLHATEADARAWAEFDKWCRGGGV